VQFRFWWLMIPLLLLACWLGARGLDADPIWIDEWWSLYNSGITDSQPLAPAEVISRVAAEDITQGPGYYLLLSLWAQFVGEQPPVLRALSLLLGLLTLALTYRLGRAEFGAFVGFGAAASLASLAFYVHFLHELRMYTLLALLTAAAVWLYLRLLEQPRRWHFPALTLTLAALGYSHNLALLTPAALALYHLLFVPKNGRWWGVTAAFVAAGVLYLPWLSVVGSGLALVEATETLQARALSFDAALLRLGDLLGNGLPLLLLVPLGAAGAALWRSAPADRRRLVALWVIVLACIGSLLALNAALRLMHAGRMRYFYHFLPLLALLLGVGFARLSMGRFLWLRSMVLLLWLLLGVGTILLNDALLRGLDGWGYRYPLHRVVRELDSRVQPGDFVVHVLPDDLYAWMYYERNAQLYLNTLPIRYATLGRETDTDRQPAQQPAVRQLIESERVWLSYLDEAPPPTALAEFSARLAPTYARCGDLALPDGLHFALWTRSPVCCSPEFADHPPLARYDSLTLTSIEVERDAAGTLDVLVGWAGGSTLPPHTYSTALHLLVATDGSLVAQSDGGVPVESFVCRRESLPTGGLPAGTYHLASLVYDWRTGARLSGEMVESGQRGDRLILTDITIP
jgi:hypothetical protein